MPLKKASGNVEVLKIDGSEVHAVMPDKGTWDAYVDELFDRDDKTGKLKARTADAIRHIYRKCVKKLVNVEGSDGQSKDITDGDEIVEFLIHLTDIDTGRKIDDWLLNRGQLTQDEQKN